MVIFEANRGREKKKVLGNTGLHKEQRNGPESILEKVKENDVKITQTDKEYNNNNNNNVMGHSIACTVNYNHTIAAAYQLIF
jgi:hypothetical protein